MASSAIVAGPGSTRWSIWLFAAATVLNLMLVPRDRADGSRSANWPASLPFVLAAAATVPSLWRIFHARGIAAIQRDRDLAFFRRHTRGR